MLSAFIMIIAAFMASCSQILLKLSTQDEHKSTLGVYLNVKVITAYVIFGITMLMNVYAFTGIQYKYGSVLSSTAYLFTMILSYAVLRERLTWRCVSGNLMIIAGIIIYTFSQAW